MKVEQRRWTKVNGWVPENPETINDSVQLVLVFGAIPMINEQKLFKKMKKHYPCATILGCSTASEIFDTQVSEDSIVVVSIAFEHTEIKGRQVQLSQVEDSFEVGQHLAQTLPPSIQMSKSGKQEELIHVFVLSDGLKVNGSDLVRGLTEYLPENVTVTGGLAGDGERFEETFVFLDSEPKKDTVAAVGLYGNRLKVGFCSMGGWDSFGPERLITRSEGNVLYELDGHSALELYKKYLGEQAKGLPATGLLFPLSLRTNTSGDGIVRTILSVDEKAQSMTFAGDVPEGSYARLMKANFDRLIDGAAEAAKQSYKSIGLKSPDLAVLISCIGRKLILKQRIEEEVEGIRDVFGKSTVLTGFYSYGEISPFNPGTKCELHNQSMTITTFIEE